MNLLDLLQPQANAAAVNATSAALDSAAQRPFSVVLSVSPETQAWINNALAGGVVSAIVVAVIAGILLKRIR